MKQVFPLMIITFLVTMIDANGQITLTDKQVIDSCWAFEQKVCDSLNKLKVGMDSSPTKYKPGFTYYERGEKCVLLKWVKVTIDWGIDYYRWRVKGQMCGVTYYFWTDDVWVDVATGEGYINKNHKYIKFPPPSR